MKYLATFVVLALMISSSGAEAADKVRMSISAIDVSFLSAGLALKRGMFRDEGLDLELIRMNANVSITALSTGDIDYTMVFASVVRGAMRGMPMKVVASFMDSSTHLLIARPEYKSIEDLKGKTLAVSTFGATFRRGGAHDDEAGRRRPGKRTEDHPARRRAGALCGLERRHCRRRRAFAADDTEAMRSGYRVLSRFYEHFKLPFTGLGTHLKKLKEKPDEVKRMTRAYVARQSVRPQQSRRHDSNVDGLGQSRPRKRGGDLRFDLEDLQRGRRHFRKRPENRHRSGAGSDENRAAQWPIPKSPTSRSSEKCRRNWGSRSNNE